MSVVEREYKTKTSFYAVNNWRDRQVWELVGTVRREAEIRDRAMKSEIAQGIYEPTTKAARSKLVGEWLGSWLSTRTKASAPDERRSVRLYVEPRAWLASKLMDDVDEIDTDRLVAELRAERKPSGERRLSDKTISNLLGTLSLAFDAGIRAKVCGRNPINLPPNTLNRRRKREPEIYTPGEFAVLVRHHSIPWPIRVLNALVLYTGMREGEACGRRWRDFEEAPGLPAMFVRDQYDAKPLKTDNPRVVPVHRELGEILTAWAQEGFELYTGQKPNPDDFIVPNVGKWARRRNHTRSSYYKAFVRHALAAGVRPRSLHATRHTFITLAQRCGAPKANVERITHNACGEMIDRYTHFWSPLCEAVSCLRLDVLPDVLPNGGSGGNSGGRRLAFLPENGAKLRSGAHGNRGSIPGASTKKQHKTGQAAEPRQFSHQSDSGIGAVLSERNAQRKRRLLSLREADPEAARPGLAVTRALDRVLEGDVDGAEDQLAAEARRAGA